MHRLGRPASPARASGTRTSAHGGASPPLAGGEPLQERQREGRGLAGAGRGLAEQVAAREQRRDRLALDRGRLLVAEVGERGEQLGAEAELGEAGAFCGRVRGRHPRRGRRPGCSRRPRSVTGAREGARPPPG